MKWVTVEMASVDMMMDAIMHILNSIEEFSLAAGVTINFQHQELLLPASGRNTLGRPMQRKMLDKWKYYSKKDTVVCPKNQDDLCVARCLMIGKRKADDMYRKNYEKSADLTRHAENLHALCKVPEGPCGLPEIKKFALHHYFQDYMINVYDAQLQCQRIYHSKPQKKVISLLIDSGHCFLITKPAGFFGSVY